MGEFGWRDDEPADRQTMWKLSNNGAQWVCTGCPCSDEDRMWTGPAILFAPIATPDEVEALQQERDQARAELAALREAAAELLGSAYVRGRGAPQRRVDARERLRALVAAPDAGEEG